MMNSRHFPIVALLAGLAMASQPASTSAQWSLEGRVGTPLPRGELTNNPGLNQTGGLGVAVDAMYTVRPNVSIYGGGSLQRFNCDGCSTDVKSIGLDGGVKFLFPADGNAQPWVRGGLMLHRAEVGDVAQDWGVGADVGVGIDWNLTPVVAVVPAVRYNAYSSGALSLNYFTIDLGIHLHLDGS